MEIQLGVQNHLANRLIERTGEFTKIKHYPPREEVKSRSYSTRFQIVICVTNGKRDISPTTEDTPK